MINLGNKRELFFDDHLINTEKTTAKKQLHKLRRTRDVIMKLDKPWEGNTCGYFSIFFAEGKWRMYYRTGNSERYRPQVAYAESSDAINWVRPSLGIVEFDGSRDNNLILGTEMLKELGFKAFDNLYVFYDEHPMCPADERYKMLCMYCGNGALICLVSSDGIHFRKSHIVTRDGEFDSQNLAFYSKTYGKYFCYYRGEHDPNPQTHIMDKSFTDKVANELADPEKMLMRAPGAGDKAFMRDVRVIESEDFHNWSEQKQINCTGFDLQFYTSGIMPYPREESIFFGISMRYTERKAWTPTYDELCGREARLHRIKTSQLRAGLAITDGVLLITRDGYNFTKFDEAILPPPPESPDAYVYGDGFAVPMILEIPSEVEGADNEYMIMVVDGYRSNLGYDCLRKYTIRLDGFVSLHAGCTEERIVTKEFTYDGDALYANIATSARGYAYFTLKCDGESYESYEIFGDSVNKRIHFINDEAIKKLSGKVVTLEVRALDCDLYAIKFDK